MDALDGALALYLTNIWLNLLLILTSKIQFSRSIQPEDCLFSTLLLSVFIGNEHLLVSLNKVLLVGCHVRQEPKILHFLNGSCYVHRESSIVSGLSPFVPLPSTFVWSHGHGHPYLTIVLKFLMDCWLPECIPQNGMVLESFGTFFLGVAWRFGLVSSQVLFFCFWAIR